MMWIEKIFEIIFVIISAFLINKLLSLYLKEKVKKYLNISELKYVFDLLNFIIYGVAILIIFQIIGIPTESILISSGILGLAIGFATKDLISNLIGGLLIVVDKPFKIGDYVEINGIRGIVKGFSLRNIKLIDVNGYLITIPCSILLSKNIYNYTKNNTYLYDIELQREFFESKKNEIKNNIVSYYFIDTSKVKVVLKFKNFEELKELLNKLYK